MLTFEMIRIDEVNRANEEEENSNSYEASTLSAGSKNKKKKLILLEHKINSSYEKNIFYNADYDLSKPLMIKRSGEINKSVKKNKTYAKKIYKSTNINIKFFPFNKKRRFEALDNLEDRDIEEEDNKYTEYVSKYLKSSIKSNNSFDKIENSKTLFESLTSKFDSEEDNTNNILNSTISGIIDSSDIKNKLIINEESKKNDILDKDEKKSNDNQNTSNNKKNSIGNKKKNQTDKIEDEINPITYQVNMEEIKNIFGEPFKEKENKLKNKSLFGNLNTYKIFRCIIKTNEDLRQEQFATQLINEFYQIFKLENTGCWLNTYEIISTGKNT